MSIHPSEYLKRIGYGGPLEPSAATLRALHRAHLYTVPFENLDIHLGRPIVLDEAAFFAKIVRARRGGFCYELNGLFAWLLRALGFGVRYLSASDAHGGGDFGPEFDHLVLRVTCPGEPGAWLADVGWGDSFVEPLPLELASEQREGLRAYRIERAREWRVVWQQSYDGVWEPQYGFTLAPRQLGDFAAMCHYHQTSPDSHFTRRRLVTRATPDGRVSLHDERLVLTTGGQRREQPVAGAAQFTTLLREHFGIELAP